MKNIQPHIYRPTPFTELAKRAAWYLALAYSMLFWVFVALLLLPFAVLLMVFFNINPG